MKRLVKSLLIVLSLTAPTVTLASIIYSFEFYNIGGGGNTLDPNPKPDFSLTLTYPGFVTTTGLSAIEGSPLSTTLGYSVTDAGTNTLGWWGFAYGTGGTITDGNFAFSGQSFLFQPLSWTTDYFTSPGTFAGTVVGNDAYNGSDFNGYAAFNGNATLTISDSAVPEPSPGWLLVAGLVGVLVSCRRNLKPAGPAQRRVG